MLSLEGDSETRGWLSAVLVTVTMAVSHDSTQPTSLASTGFWGPDEGLGDVCSQLKFVLIFFLIWSHFVEFMVIDVTVLWICLRKKILKTQNAFQQFLVLTKQPKLHFLEILDF